MGGLRAGGNGGLPPSERGPTRAGGSHALVVGFFKGLVLCWCMQVKVESSVARGKRDIRHPTNSGLMKYPSVFDVRHTIEMVLERRI